MQQCRTCGLVQVVPMPSAREIAKLYHEDFDHFAPYLEQIEVHRKYFRRVLHVVIPGLTRDPSDSPKNGFRLGGRNDKKKRLLDIGCAMGVLLEEAQKLGIEAVGVDISEDAVTYCKRRGLTVHAGTIQSLGKTLSPASFDVVTAFQIIEHERDPLGFMRRIHKLLKKGGWLVLATPNYGGWGRTLMGRRWVGFTHPEHVTLWDPGSLTFLLTKVGFKSVKVRRDTPRPFPLSFAFTRAADYFPFLAWFLKPVGRLLDRFHLKNPINPWDDMIVYART